MAHRKLDLVFGPRVNSIIGDNAAGKSTIIRAIRYVARNKPSGDSVISWDKKQTRVSLSFGKDKIIRTRGKGINEYKLNKNKPYKAFGRGNIPPAITKVLSLSDINFQGQHEAPFWFCKSPGEVSRELNTIVNLDTIDKTLSSILSSIRKSKATVGVIEERLKEAKKKKQSLAYIKEMNDDLLDLESLEKAKNENAVRSILLKELIGSAKIHAEQADVCHKHLSRANLVLDIALKRLNISQNQRSLRKLLKSAKKLRKIIKNRPPSFADIRDTYKRLEKMFTKKKELSTLIKEAGKKLSEIKPIKQRIIKYTQRVDKIMKERCPLCQTKL